MAEVYEARRANLLKLAEQHGGKKNLGELLDYTNGSYISQLISRKRRMSEPVARKIETTLHLAHGWMDKAPRPVVDGA
jgi:hypothetical protein